MEEYISPRSELIEGLIREHKPVLGIVIGLLTAVVVSTITSIIIAILFTLVLKLDPKSPQFLSILYENYSYLIVELAVSTVVLFFAGRSVGKRTPGKELKYGLVLSVLILVLYILSELLLGNGIRYPTWYVVLSFSIFFVAIPYGALSMRKHNHTFVHRS